MGQVRCPFRAIFHEESKGSFTMIRSLARSLARSLERPLARSSVRSLARALARFLFWLARSLAR